MTDPPKSRRDQYNDAYGETKLDRFRLWSTALIIVMVSVICIGGFFLIAFDDRPPRDAREVRRYGDLECVYHPHEDKVEACVSVGR